MKIKKITIFFAPLFFLSFLVFFSPLKVFAQCGAGSYCAGSTRVDRITGCQVHETANYCVTSWDTNYWATCNGDCEYDFYSGSCASDFPNCTYSSTGTHHQGYCCTAGTAPSPSSSTNPSPPPSNSNPTPSPLPTPSTATIRVRTVGISGNENVCSQIRNSTNLVYGSYVDLDPGVDGFFSNSDGNYHKWFNKSTNTSYTMTVSPPSGSNYTVGKYCWEERNRNTGNFNTGEGQTDVLEDNKDRLTWDVGLIYGPSPTPSPSPTPTPASCNQFCTNDSHCQAGLVCVRGNICRRASCTASTNCVCATPTPSPTPTSIPGASIILRARMVPVSEGAFCSEINAACPTGTCSPNGGGGVIGFTRISPNPSSFQGTQVSSNYITWNGINSGWYTLNLASPPLNNPAYIVGNICWVNSSGGSGVGPAALTTDGQVVTYNVGISTPAQPWVQFSGNVHSNAGVNVPVPINKKLISAESGVTSGVLSYATGTLNVGSGTVSDSGFQVQDIQHQFPTGFTYYDYYYNQFLSKTTLNNGANDPISGVYEYNGNLNLTGQWRINSGQIVVIFVTGNLAINTDVDIDNGGFLAFIVDGDVTVWDNVGANSSNYKANPDKFNDSNIAGIYIIDGLDGSGGTVYTATSSTSDRQLVFAGTVVANQLVLRRDLSNDTYPGELFLFRQDLWANAPEELKVIKVTWQEVNP